MSATTTTPTPTTAPPAVPTPTPAAAVAATPSPSAPPPDPVFAHLAQRYAAITKHFPTALSASDFVGRTEMALALHGFRGDNSIAVTNFCRDEATALLKDKIDAVFGSSFNINGLGAGLTCGCLGAPTRALLASAFR